MASLVQMKHAGIAFQPQRVLVYGETKVGKTEAVGRAIGMLPQIKKVIWFDLERGHTTLFKLDDSILEKIVLIKVEDKAKDPCAIFTIMSVIEGDKVQVCDRHGKLKSKCPVCAKNKESEYITVHLDEENYETLVVIDSMTQLSKSALFNAVKNSGADLADLDMDEKATFNHYGAQGRYLDKVTTDFQTLNCNLIVISHEQNIKDNSKKEKLTAVAGTSNFARQFPKAFDHVVRLYMMNGKHVGISNTTDNVKINAGSRLNSNVYEDGEIRIANCWKAGPATNTKAPVTSSKVATSKVVEKVGGKLVLPKKATGG